MMLKETIHCLEFVKDLNSYAVKLGTSTMSNKQVRFIAFSVTCMIMYRSLHEESTEKFME